VFAVPNILSRRSKASMPDETIPMDLPLDKLPAKLDGNP
jgi:hypothetical protein